jgi:pyrroline-5-carboxylate reductase
MIGGARIVLVGAGQMGRALLGSWLRSGIPASRISVVDPGLSSEARAAIEADNLEVLESLAGVAPAGIMVIAVKPHVIDIAVRPLSPLVGPNTVALSIVTGKTLAYLETQLGSIPIVRAMPNTPAQVGRGVTGAFTNRRLDETQRKEINTLLSASGSVEWLASEDEIDSLTAVSGCGPAYVFHLVECMARAGEKLGLPADLSMRLARQTVIGAGELLRVSADDATTLRRNVTSSGGTTAAALSVLADNQRMQKLFEQALRAARTRAKSLA